MVKDKEAGGRVRGGRHEYGPHFMLGAALHLAVGSVGEEPEHERSGSWVFNHDHLFEDIAFLSGERVHDLFDRAIDCTDAGDIVNEPLSQLREISG